jgi:hypothetical protein
VGQVKDDRLCRFVFQLESWNDGDMESWVAEYDPIQKTYVFFDYAKLDNIPVLDPIFQHSNIPTKRNEMSPTPLWGETKAWSSGPGFFI